MELDLFSGGDMKSIGRIYKAILAGRDGVDAVGSGSGAGRLGVGRISRRPARSRAGSVAILSSRRSGCGAEEESVLQKGEHLRGAELRKKAFFAELSVLKGARQRAEHTYIHIAVGFPTLLDHSQTVACVSFEAVLFFRPILSSRLRRFRGRIKSMIV